MGNPRLEDMTWPEIRAAIEGGQRTVIVAVASMEQHGPALPVNTDAVIGDAQAAALARELGDALVAPVVYPGCSDHHLAWPGTLSVPREVLADVLGGVVEGLARAGFEEIILFPSHGGNFDPVRAALPAIRQRALQAEVVDLLDIRAVLEAWFSVTAAHGFPDRTPPHADLIETSMMLYLRPDSVRADRLERGFVGQPDFTVMMREGLQHYTDNGVLGDPRGASPGIGKDLIDAWVRYAAEEIRRRRMERPGGSI